MDRRFNEVGQQVSQRVSVERYEAVRRWGDRPAIIFDDKRPPLEQSGAAQNIIAESGRGKRPSAAAS